METTLSWMFFLKPIQHWLMKLTTYRKQYEIAMKQHTYKLTDCVLERMNVPQVASTVVLSTSPSASKFGKTNKRFDQKEGLHQAQGMNNWFACNNELSIYAKANLFNNISENFSFSFLCILSWPRQQSLFFHKVMKLPLQNYILIKSCYHSAAS